MAGTTAARPFIKTKTMFKKLKDLFIRLGLNCRFKVSYEVGERIGPSGPYLVFYRSTYDMLDGHRVEREQISEATYRVNINN